MELLSEQAAEKRQKAMEFTQFRGMCLIGLGLAAAGTGASLSQARAHSLGGESPPSAEITSTKRAVAPAPQLDGALSKVRIAHKARRGAAPDQIVLEAAVDHELASDAALGVTMTVYDASWRPVHSPQTSPVVRQARGKKMTTNFATPSGLDDGYYRSQLLGAASENDDLATESAEVLFRVQSGVAALVSRKEYEQKSGMNDSIN